MAGALTDRIPSPPLSPAEREALTEDDLEKIADWRRRLHGYEPRAHDWQRLFLHGKAARNRRGA